MEVSDYETAYNAELRADVAWWFPIRPAIVFGSLIIKLFILLLLIMFVILVAGLVYITCWFLCEFVFY